jgi:hypothetical protein
MLEEDRKRRQFEEQKQKLRLLSSVKPKVSHIIIMPGYCLSTALVLSQFPQCDKDTWGAM